MIGTELRERPTTGERDNVGALGCSGGASSPGGREGQHSTSGRKRMRRNGWVCSQYSQELKRIFTDVGQ